jgi:YaiO family outer membrane protein
MRPRKRVHAVIGALVAAMALVVEAQEWESAIRAGYYVRARVELERALQLEPEDSALRYRLARVHALSGATEAALAEFDSLLSSHPDDADYLLGRAQMLARLGRDAEALEETARALSLAPDYEDVWRLRLQLAERGASTALAEQVRREVAARYPDAVWWQRSLAAPTTFSRTISVGWGDERLSGSRPGWNQQFVRLDWQASADVAWFAEIYRDERFDRSDSSVNAGGTWRALPEWRLGGALGVTGNADFEPLREVSVDAQRSWSGGWGTGLHYRYRDYATDAVSSYALTGDRYIANYRVAYQVTYSRLHGASSSLGHGLVLGWYPTDTRSFAITFGAGEEIERVELDELLRTRVASVTLSGREILSSRWTLNWWLGTHEQGDFYRRRYAGAAVRVGF